MGAATLLYKAPSLALLPLFGNALLNTAFLALLVLSFFHQPHPPYWSPSLATPLLPGIAPPQFQDHRCPVH